MDYKVVSKIHISNKHKKIGEFLYEPDIDGLSFTGKYPFPVQLRISRGLSKVEVTPMFLKLPFILRGWINIDMLLREIDLMKMVLQGKLLLHASCVGNTLIVGFPQSGKTYLTYRSVSAGMTLISEEYTIIAKDLHHLNGYRAYPYKKISRSCLSQKTIKNCDIKLTPKEQMTLALNTIRAKLMPFMFESVIWKKIPVSGETSEIKWIVYGSTNVLVTDYRQLIILTENEFPFMSDYFLEVYALCSGLDLIDIQNKQRQLIKEFVNAINSFAKLPRKED